MGQGTAGRGRIIPARKKVRPAIFFSRYVNNSVKKGKKGQRPSLDFVQHMLLKTEIDRQRVKDVEQVLVVCKDHKNLKSLEPSGRSNM